MDDVNMQSENPRRYKALLQVACNSTKRSKKERALCVTRTAGQGRVQQVLLSLSQWRVASRCCSARYALHQQVIQAKLQVSRAQSINLFDPIVNRGFRQHHIVFLHGVTQRAMRCSLANLTVDWFESEPNPPNGSVLVMRRSSDRDSGQRWSEQWCAECWVPPACLHVLIKDSLDSVRLRWIEGAAGGGFSAEFSKSSAK